MSSRPWTIGVHFTAGDEISRHYVDGVLGYAAERPEVRIRDFSYPGYSPQTSGLPPWTGKADGIVASIPRAPGTMAWLRRGGAPVVLLGADLCRETYSVFTDARSLARLAVPHLVGVGVRSFAYVGSRAADGSLERWRLMAAELAKHAMRLLRYDVQKIYTGTYQDFESLEEAEPGLVHLLQSAEKPLGVMAINDRVAVAVCRVVQALGMSIPDDVAVLGVGDLEIARTFLPPISSIRPARERIGYEGTRMLHGLMQGKPPARRVLRIPVEELLERQSTIGKHLAAATDVQRALEFIRRNACDGIRVRDVAAHVHLALRTFELQFAAAQRRTVGDEIRSVRLARAKTLLETTDLPLARVANQVGFQAASYLNQFFRRETGITPAKYRKRLRQQ
jgi:LacI family transcriptional regulator